MAALANPFQTSTFSSPASAVVPRPYDALARLAALHAEASETARLANLLGRTLHTAIALPVLAAVAAALAAEAFAPAIAWAGLVAIGVIAILRCYARVARQPFERAVLKAFASDLDACLAYAGAAWGAGAFLVIPPLSSGGAALAFALVPSLTVAAMLREKRPALFFLAPVAVLSALACVMQPFADGALSGVLVILACGVFAGALHIPARAGERHAGDGLPVGTFETQSSHA